MLAHAPLEDMDDDVVIVHEDPHTRLDSLEAHEPVPLLGQYLIDMFLYGESLPFGFSGTNYEIIRHSRGESDV
jgi:hypothetical protein